MLELKNISKIVKHKTILSNCNLTLYAGHVQALVGKNGLGKSTLMSIAAGLAKESGGKVLIGGKPMSYGKRHAHVWYSSNDTNTQFFCDSVESELLLMALRDKETLQRARELLKRLDLYEVRSHHPATLSGGQRLRLSLACGVMSGRSVLIFDEPTSGLDGASMRVVASLLQEMATAGNAVAVITHDTQLIETCCDTVIDIARCQQHDSFEERNICQTR